MRRGRVANALARRLAADGWIVTVGPIGAVGGYRRWKRLDDTIVCWEAWAYNPEVRQVRIAPGAHLVSYDTMTACARHGVTIRPDRDDDWTLAWVDATPSGAVTSPR